MSRKKQFIDRASAVSARAYLLRKCTSGDDYIVRGVMTEYAFVKEISRFRFDDEMTLDIELRNFSRLCFENLSDGQWRKLRTAIRVARSKAANKLVSIDISTQAHQVLVGVAATLGEGVSLSDAIEELARHYSSLNFGG